MTGGGKPAHYRGDYHVRARHVRAAAYADPTTRCWRGGHTLAEARALWGTHVKWTAGHLVDGQEGGPLAPECSHCNYGAGARLRNGPGPRTDLTW